MTNKNSHRNLDNSTQQSGAALVVAILSVLLVTVIGIALVSTGMVSLNVSENSRQRSEVYYISEAGLTHGINLVKTAGPSEFTSILQAGDGSAYTGDELSTRPASEIPIPAAGIVFGKGHYVVYVSDDPGDTDGDPNADSNGKLVITSVGFGEDGSTAQTEAIISSTAGTARLAILADGVLKNSNNVWTYGPGGSIHANDSVETSSDICVESIISHSSANTMNLSKITSDTLCSTPGTVGTNVFYSGPKVTPDIFDVAKLQTMFRPQADYIFKADGYIYAAGGAFPMTAAEITAAGLDPWSWNSGSKLWSYSSGTVISTGTYYMEGCNAKISNGGDDVTPPTFTLIVEGSVEITNSPAFQPKLAGYALVAGNDIKISSKIGVNGNPGLVYAYGHMEVTNQATIYGWLHATNFRQTDGTNGPDVDDPGGNNLVDVSSKGTLRLSNKTWVYTPSGGGGPTGLTVLSRREVRY